MTCIVGLVDKGAVYIGGDSAGVAGYSLSVRADAKVWASGGMVFGFTSSFRMGQLLRYKLSPPARLVDQGTDEYLAGPWIDAVRDCLKAGGYASTDDGQEVGGQFLVGYEGRLFEISSDYQVGEPIDPYAAVGCGHDLAKGSLFSTEGDPTDRVLLALEAAERFSAGVRAPFVVETLPPS